MPSENYQALAELLTERLSIIADSELRENDPSEQLNRLMAVSNAITHWHTDHRKGLPQQLNHYLIQCSYSKALDFLRSENVL